MGTVAPSGSGSGTAIRVDILQRIFEHPGTLTPLLNELVTHAHRSYSDSHFSAYNVDLFRRMIDLNIPYLNVVIAAMLIDTVDSIRERVLALDPSDFNRQFLIFMKEKCTHLRSDNFSASNMRETFQHFATMLVNTYLMRNIVVVRHVVRDVENERSFDDLGYAPSLTAETIANARRRYGDGGKK